MKCPLPRLSSLILYKFETEESMFKRVAQAYKVSGSGAFDSHSNCKGSNQFIETEKWPDQVLGDSLLRSQYDVSGEDGLAKDWWPDDPDASDSKKVWFIQVVVDKKMCISLYQYILIATLLDSYIMQQKDAISEGLQYNAYTHIYIYIYTVYSLYIYIYIHT